MTFFRLASPALKSTLSTFQDIWWEMLDVNMLSLVFSLAGNDNVV